MVRNDCEVHAVKLQYLEERIQRIEKFLLAILVFFASGSVVTVQMLYSINSKLPSGVHQSSTERNGDKHSDADNVGRTRRLFPDNLPLQADK